MKKFVVSALSLLACVAAFAIASSSAQAGPPTPIGIAEAKSAAKTFIHDYCRNHNCRGSRVQKCESKTDFRVDCKALYGKGERDICRFTIIVRAVKDQQLRFAIKGVRCNDR